MTPQRIHCDLLQGQSTGAKAPQGKDFASILSKANEKEHLKISAHAQKRLDSSQVSFSDSDIERLDGAVKKASDKGSNQSLILMDNLALVVSVKNRTVITAIDDARRKEGVFTNIDSVVIA